MNLTEPVTFLVPRWRPALNVALIVLSVMLLFRGLLLVAGLAAGFSLEVSDYVEAVLIAVLTAAAGAAGAMVGIGRNPGWVRLSEAGLEFAAARHRAIFLPWAAVAAVRLRRPGPFTQLVVTPTGPDGFLVARTPGRTPRLRRGAFVIDVGSIRPSPAALLAELTARRATPTH